MNQGSRPDSGDYIGKSGRRWNIFSRLDQRQLLSEETVLRCFPLPGTRQEFQIAWAFLDGVQAGAEKPVGCIQCHFQFEPKQVALKVIN